MTTKIRHDYYYYFAHKGDPANISDITGFSVGAVHHDLVHDLARSVIGDELIVIAAAKASHNTSQPKYCRYAVLTNYDGQTKLSNILPKKVRALHFSGSSKLGHHHGSFSFAKCLRIMDFSECSGIILPSSIGQLNQLRCLLAPKLQDERLPESIAELSKLQCLSLGRSHMCALPESIGKLSGRTYLCLPSSSSIKKFQNQLVDYKI
jgi:nucleoside-diphosphate-sugar epimerase